MIRRTFSLAVAAAILAVLSVFPTAAQSTDGIIQGVVKNGTQNTAENTTAALTVRLVTYNDAGNVVDWADSVTGADSSFRFEGVATDTTYQHLVSVEYLGVEYTSDPVVFADGDAAPKSTEVSIYETTTDDESIVVLNTHMAVYTDEKPFRVVEQYTFFNEGDRTYIGANGDTIGESGTLAFSLPDGAKDVEPSLGLVTGSVMSTADGFADTTPVTPGTRLVSFSYHLPGNSGSLDFSKTINYQTYSQSVVVLGGHIEVSSDQLPQQDILVIPDNEGNDREWTLVSGSDLARGTELRVTVSGLSRSGSEIPWIIGALVAAATVFLVIYFLVRRRRLQSETVQAPRAGRAGGSDIESKKEGLLSQIAQLDDDFEEGTISREAYERARSDKKSELLKLMRQTKNGTNGRNTRE